MPWNRLWDWLGDDWLRSQQAAKIFFVATILIPATTLQMSGRVTPLRLPVWARYPWVIICMAGTCGLFFLWFGMWRYWAKLDDSGKFTKRLWFVILLFGLWLGGCLYYYGAYLPQVIRGWKGKN